MKHRGVMGLATVLAVAGLGVAGTTDQSESIDWPARVQALEARIAELEAGTSERWLTDQRAEEVRALVQDVLADADTRSSLLQDGMTAGWDNGFFIASTDGNFKLKLHGSLQVNYFWNSQNNSPEDDHRGGFQVKRANLWLDGHILDPSWQYHIKWMAFGNDGQFRIVDAFVRKGFENKMYALAGQFRLPFAYEMLTSYHNTLTVDRSDVSYTRGVGRSQGVEVGYKNESLWLRGAFSNGKQSPRGAPAGWFDEDTEYAFTGRVDYLFEGNWKQFTYDTSFPTDEFGARIGAAVHYEDGEYGTDADELERLAWTVDATMKFSGANVYAAVFGEHTESTTVDRDQIAFVVHGGYFITDDWELYARYQWGDDDIDSTDDLSVITVGVNRYFLKNNLKLTADINYGLNEISSSWLFGLHGLRADAPGEDGQIAVRTQLQLVF